MRGPREIFACTAALLAATVLVGEPHAASPRQRLADKAAQAQQVLRQVNDLDRQLGVTVEAWDGARYELQVTRARLVQERALLHTAERQRRIAVGRVEKRLVTLYENPDDQTTIGILLGSSNVSEMLARLDASRTVAAADHALAVEATTARNRYAAAERQTRATEERRAVAFSQLDAQRKRITEMLAQRRQLLSTIKSQMATIHAQEVRQQAELAAQARARLAREQAALKAQALARARAAAAASRPTPTQPTTTTTTAAATTTTAPVTTVPDVTTTTSVPTAPNPLPATTAGPGHPEAATIAMRYLGIPYVWGGASPAGFDCSGLVMYVFAQLGISLPHYAAAQYAYGTPVARDQLQPGDLVFFDGLGHVGIYIGGGEMIHAPQTGDVVKITPLSEFGSRYVGARRI